MADPVQGWDSTRVAGPPVVRSVAKAWDDALKESRWLGRYLILDELGRGGMGVVQRAYDPELERVVALKLVRVDRRDPVYEARLIREARAMARLNHPNVVQVFDVEVLPASEAGVVVVMEYVPGANFAAWIAENRPSRAEMLRLLVQSGRGLAAAHREGLLHRDFKFDNVLIGRDGRARVTDFGLARFEPGAEPSSAEATEAPVLPGASDGHASAPSIVALTEAGAVVGTPRYMAPEQLAGDQLDARCDQYAFCVAAWRALAGHWPFDGRDLNELALAKRNRPPAVPRRASAPRHVLQALRRGLEPDPTKRWASLDDLLLELQRRPAQARKVWLAGGAVVALAATSYGWNHFEQARRLADCDRRSRLIESVWNVQRAETIGQQIAAADVGYASRAWELSKPKIDAYVNAWRDGYRESCRQTVDPPPERSGNQASLDCLAAQREAVDELLRQFTDPDGGVLQNVGTAVSDLPRVEQCRDSAWLRSQAEAPTQPELRASVATLRGQLARVSALSNVARFEAARELANDVLRAAEDLGFAPLVVEAKMALADATEELGAYEQAARLAEQTYFEAEAVGCDTLALRASNELIFVLGRRLGAYDDALEWGRRSKAILARLGGQDELARAQMLNNLAIVHLSSGNSAEAVRLCQHTVALREAVLGPDHPRVAVSLGNLGTAQEAAGQYEEAKLNQLRALRIRRASLGERHPQVIGALQNLGLVHRRLEEWSEAAAAYEEALGAIEETAGENDPNFFTTATYLANARLNGGELDAAEELYARLLTIAEREDGPAVPRVAGPVIGLAQCALHRERPGAALPLAERGLALLEQTATTPLQLGAARMLVARALVGAGRERGRAVALARQAVRDYEQGGKESAVYRDEAVAFIDENTPPS